MGKSRAKAFFEGRAGTTLAELLVAVAIMSIGCLGLFGAFTYISKSLFISRAQTLATNLAQEKIEVLKNATYYDLMLTTAALTDARFTPNILYDNVNYPPETITISGINYTRYTYVTMVDMSSGVITSVSSDYPDTGLKEIVVNLVWTSNGAPKKWTLTNLLENPAVNPLDSTLTGTITISGGGNLASAKVVVEQNNNWSGTTNNSGVYNFSVYHGTYTVRASSAGFYDEVSPNTLVARGGSATPTINPLERISTGSVAGIAWYNNDLVISQVVVDTLTITNDLDPTRHDVEYVELFNPTTFTINTRASADTSGTPNSMTLYYGDHTFTHYYCDCNWSSTNMNVVRLSSFVAPGSYYLYANSPYFYINGTKVTADASYVGKLLNVDNADSVILYRWTPSTFVDEVGWTDTSNHTPPWYYAPFIPNGGYTGPGDPAGQQIVRVSSPVASTANIKTYGRAYNSQVNKNDYLQLPAGSADFVPPKTSASGTFPVISGKVPSGVVVSASDMNSASQTFFATTIASGALNLSYVPFTMTGVTTGTYSVALDYTGAWPTFTDYTQVISNVLVSQNQTTPIPSNTTTPAWTAANLYEVQLTSSPDTGFVKGTVTDINNVPISVPVTGGGNTKLSAANGQYFMNVASGTISLTANATNATGSNTSYVQQVLPVVVNAGAVTTQNYVLSLGARLTGYCTTGATPVPNQVINALQGGNQMGTATTDGTGVFTIPNIATGTYTIATVIGTGQSSTPTSATFAVGAPGITAVVTAVGTVFVGTFTISGAYGSIYGTVTDNTAGSPAGLVTSGALILASTNTITASPPAIAASSAAAQVPVYMISVKADGSYTLPLRAATYNLRVFVPVDAPNGTISVHTKNYSGIVVGVGTNVNQAVVLP